MLLVFGAINIDTVFAVDRLPRAGDELWSSRSRTEPGGRGANQAVAAARDGARVSLAGAVGEDVLADAALAQLHSASVDLGYVQKVARDTGRSAVCVDAGGYSTVVADPGANRMARASQIPDAALSGNTTLLLQRCTDDDEVTALILRARKRGCRIILNLSPAGPIGVEALRAVDILLANTPDLAWLGEHLGTGNNPGSLHAALGVTTLRMMGAQGAELMSDAGFLHMPALPVHTRDTTGAGDCFAGVFAGSLSNALALPMALRRATVAAALSTEKLGAQRAMPDRASIDAALEKAPEPAKVQAEIME